jgi:hypothetical protein
MIRPSSKFSGFGAISVLAVAALSVACGSHPSRGPGFATATELPEAPRRPDGVVVDPSPELPPATEVADPSARLVALKPPLPEKAARMVVVAFFRAIVTEDLEALSELVTSDANAPSRTRGGAPGMIDHWRGRMRHFRYRALAGEVLYQEADVELYRYDDLEVAIPGRPPRPPDMLRSDVLLRVPMLVVRAGSDRVFGDEIVFLLRRDKDRFRIRQLVEDFQIP